MKILILTTLLVSTFAMAEVKDFPDIAVIKQLSNNSWKSGLTNAFMKCREKVELAILKAAKQGEYTVLVELDYAPGFTPEAVVRYLKNSGYEAVALEVGELPGTSMHSFVQVSWFNKENK